MPLGCRCLSFYPGCRVWASRRLLSESYARWCGRSIRGVRARGEIIIIIIIVINTYENAIKASIKISTFLQSFALIRFPALGLQKRTRTHVCVSWCVCVQPVSFYVRACKRTTESRIIYIVCFDSIYILGNAIRAERRVTSTAHNGNFSSNNV